MNTQFYFLKEDDETCYTLDYWKQYLIDEELDEITLIKAERRKNEDGFFYCKEYQEWGETAEGTCGRECKYYEPRNGKSGICKHYTLMDYEPTDETFVLKRES